MARSGAGMGCLRFSVIFISVLCLICSMALIGLGSYVMVKFSEYGPGVQKTWQAAPIIVIVLGCTVLVVSLLGCCGAIRDNYCMLYMYGTFLVIILVAEFVAAILAIVYKDQVGAELHDIFKKGIADYGTVEEVTKAIDLIQETFKCCGATNETDYRPKPTPPSCDPQYRTIGCITQLGPYLQQRLLVIAIIMFFVIAIQLTVSIVAYVMARQLRSYENV